MSFDPDAWIVTSSKHVKRDKNGGGIKRAFINDGNLGRIFWISVESTPLCDYVPKFFSSGSDWYVHDVDKGKAVRYKFYREVRDEEKSA